MLKTMSKKLIVALVCIVVAASVGVGTTLAYIFAKAPPIENTFTPVTLSCETEGSVKTGVSVKNTGEVDGYVRAVVLCNWVSETDKSVYASELREGTDYTATWNTSSWIKGVDGFYYFVSPVKAGESTDVLVSSFTRVSEPPKGYFLEVNVYATAIQAEPAAAVFETWGITVLENGNLSL